MPTLAPAPAQVRKPYVKPPVLIADRDALLAERAGRYLRRYGYDVSTATGGVECWAQLHQRPWALLVLDLKLPWGGGDGVFALLRDDPTLPRLPVILAGSRFEPLARWLTPPVVGLLERPYSPAALLGVIRSAAAEWVAPSDPEREAFTSLWPSEAEDRS